MNEDQGGMKYDTGKVKANIIFEDFSDALYEIARVCTYGDKKYKRSSWKTVPNALERYSDAKSRHLLEQYRKTGAGEYDEESELLHAAHEAWGALARLQLITEVKYLKQKQQFEGMPPLG